MADQAVTAAGGEGRSRRWGPTGYAGEWVWADDVGTGERVRWIEEEGAAGAGPARRADGGAGGRPVA